MSTIWAYCRVSTHKDEQDESLISQSERAEAFANDNASALRVFEERASARNVTARPVLSSLLQELESLPPRRRPKYLFVTALDRLYRNISDGMYIGQLLREAKVPIFVSGRGEVILDTFANRARFVGESLGGDAENEGRSKRAQDSWERRRRAGAPMSNNRPYGLYLSHNADAIDPASAEWVRKAFEWYAAGDGTHVIAKRMHEGAPTQTWLSTRIGLDGLRIPKSKSVKTWDTTRVAKLLRLQAYRGTIVPPEVFDTVQDRLAKLPKYDNERKSEYPLSGAMECSTCGRHLHGRTAGLPKKRLADGTLRKYVGFRKRYYTCVVCHYSVRADSIEAVFFSDIRTLIGEPALLKRWIAPLQCSKTEAVALKKELRRLEALNDSRRVSERRDQLFNLALAASISSSDFKHQMDRLDADAKERAYRCAAISKQLNVHENQRASVDHATALLSRFTEIYSRACYEDRRTLLASLVSALGGLKVSPAGLQWRQAVLANQN
jgi:DNA invertase Pin-like site-specific DNA recombinase